MLNHPFLSGPAGLAVLLVGLYVFFKNPKSKVYQAFLYLCSALFLWFFGNAMSMIYYSDFDIALLWFKIGYIGVPFISTTYYHLCIEYLKKKKTLLKILYAITILEVVYLWLPVNINGINENVYFLPLVGAVWGKMFTRYFNYMFFNMVLYMFVSVYSAYLYLNAYRKESNELIKNQFKILFILQVLLTFAGLEWLVIFDVPFHPAWILIFPFISLIAYNITKYKLFSVHPQFEEIKQERKYELSQGMSYLVKEHTNDGKSLDIFSDQVLGGRHGLLITRTNPEIVREKTQLKKTPMIWLTEVHGDNNIDPSRIEELSYSITNFIDSVEGGVVLLEGIPYLISYSDFNLVLRLIRTLKDNMSTKKAILIIPLNPKAFNEQEFNLIEDELKLLEI